LLSPWKRLRLKNAPSSIKCESQSAGAWQECCLKLTCRGHALGRNRRIAMMVQ
jgi:hypothetical protein